MEKPIKEIGFSSKQIKMFYGAPIIMLVGFVLLIILTKKIVLMPLIFGVITLITSSLNAKHKVVKLYSKHFLVQLGIINAKKMILYNHIINIIEKDNKLVITYKEGDKEKTVKIIKKVIEEEEFIYFKKFIEEKITNLLNTNPCQDQ